MKKNYLIAGLLLLIAGVQAAWAQPGMVIRKNNGHVAIPISQVVSVDFVNNIKDYIEYEYVDLGLPSGTLWATCNIGAASPEDFGDYFAWGETETKSDFSWSTYKWMKWGGSSYDKINKYTFEDNQQAGCWYSDGSFVGDNKRRLIEADDAAACAWGSDWQMLTLKQFEELTNNSYTTSEYTTLNGVKGQKITGKNGNSIFLPGAGFCQGTASSGVGEIGYYWSRSLSQNYCDFASFFWFFSGASSVTHTDRYLGLSIRPVRKNYEFVDLGLSSGTLWATCNVGADSPEESGDYFAWGETETKENYEWSTYTLCRGSEYSINKYDASLMNLLPEDDVATVKWGDSWRMPTADQLKELRDDCSREWTTRYGAGGYLFTGPNGNSVFFPAHGRHIGWDVRSQSGFYWARTIYDEDGIDKRYSYLMLFDSEELIVQGYLRYCGLNVRPVRVK